MNPEPQRCPVCGHTKTMSEILEEHILASKPLGGDWVYCWLGAGMGWIERNKTIFRDTKNNGLTARHNQPPI